MSFLTLEDVNTVNLNHINEFHEIDTSKISLQEFENILYDFCKVSHSINGSEHTFTFEIHNSLWSKLYNIAKTNDDIMFVDYNFTASLNGDILTVITSEPGIKLRLLLCSYYKHSNLTQEMWIPINSNINVTKKEPILDPPLTVSFYDYLLPEIIREGEITGHIMDNIYEVSHHMYVLVNLIKTDLLYDLTETRLQVGNINTVRLNVDQDYLPGGDLTDDNPLDITVIYKGTENQATYDSEAGENGDYVVELDLTNKTNNNPVTVEVRVNESKYINGQTNKHILKCDYITVDNFNDLTSAIVQGAEIIELSGDITFDGDLTLPQNLYLIGDGHRVNLRNHTVFVDGVSCKCKAVDFINGSPCFVQGAGSKLELLDCGFNNAKITDRHKGSVISTLNDDNITSILTRCIILNCHHTIWHNGELSVNNIKALYNNFNEATDTDYSEFLTQWQGTANITNSTFDIDFNTQELCQGETDIKYAESLIGLSPETTLNGYTADKLQNDNTLPLFTNPYNNQSHIYARYYYPAIEECVITSPEQGYENKSACHTILGTDWVYKNNAKVTRADSENVNNNRKINWEDI